MCSIRSDPSSSKTERGLGRSEEGLINIFPQDGGSVSCKVIQHGAGEKETNARPPRLMDRAPALVVFFLQHYTNRYGYDYL